MHRREGSVCQTKELLNSPTRVSEWDYNLVHTNDGLERYFKNVRYEQRKTDQRTNRRGSYQ